MNRWPERSSRPAIIVSPVGWDHCLNTTHLTTFQISSPQSWMSKRPARIRIATRSSNSVSASSNTRVRAKSRKSSAPGSGLKVLGSWEKSWVAIPPEITKITGITDAMVPGHRIDESAVDDLLSRVGLVIAHNAQFDRRFLEKRVPLFATKHWACSRADIDRKAEGIRSWALEFIAYPLGFFHNAHRAVSDCRATVHVLAQRLPGSGRLPLQLFWSRRDCRYGGYGRGTQPLRRKIF